MNTNSASDFSQQSSADKTPAQRDAELMVRFVMPSDSVGLSPSDMRLLAFVGIEELGSLSSPNGAVK